MALFEFDAGRLVPAQFGRPVSQGLEADVLESIRAQVLEVIDRPLFPVAWINPDQTEPDGGPHSLTALDASGQVVSVEVLSRLDPVTLVNCLSRLGEISSLGWMDLASRYPGGVEAFQTGWAEFREIMPPNPQAGPRLILVVADIDPAVYTALGVLYASGLEIHRVTSREMSNGRRFLEVMQVTPGMIAYHRPQIGGHQAPRAQLSWQAENGEEDVRPTPVSPPLAEIAEQSTIAEQPVAGEQEAGADRTGVATRGAIPEATAPRQPAVSADQSGEPEQVADNSVPETAQPASASKSTLESQLLSCDPAGLQAIATVIGQPAVLLWSDPRGRIVEALLTVEGQIDPGNGQLTDDVEAAFQFASGGNTEISGWDALRIGNNAGPTLSEAVGELNREITRDFKRKSSQSDPSNRD